MTLLELTTYDDIRAVLGVSEEEIEDTTLSLSVYEFNLASEIDDVDLDIAEAYEEIRESDLDGMEKAELRFYQATRLFATYSVAKQLLGALPLFSPKEISDGKASTGRYADNPYRDTIKTVKSQYEASRTRLKSAFAGYQTTTAAPVALRPYFSVVAPISDPVEGT